MAHNHLYIYVFRRPCWYGAVKIVSLWFGEFTYEDMRKRSRSSSKMTFEPKDIKVSTSISSISYFILKRHPSAKARKRRFCALGFEITGMLKSVDQYMCSILSIKMADS
jgi:hypothetical protein